MKAIRVRFILGFGFAGGALAMLAVLSALDRASLWLLALLVFLFLAGAAAGAFLWFLVRMAS